VCAVLCAIVAPTLAAADDDYLSRCAIYSDGRVTRLTEFPVRVRLGPVPSALASEGYDDAFREAARVWGEATDGLVECVFVENGDSDARVDIPVRWVTKLSTFSTENRLAHTSLIRSTGGSFRISMEMGVYNRQTGKRLTYDEMLTAALHELGHAFGLWGHSDDGDDIMAAASEALRPTARDVATLRLLYAMPVDASMHKRSLAVVDQQLAESPNNANLHYLRGSVLLDSGYPDAAVDALLQSLELNPGHSGSADKIILAYLAAGRTQDAVTRLETQGDSGPEFYNNAGIAWADQGETGHAIAAFENALRIKPDYAVARRNLARVYAAQGAELSDARDYVGAEASLREAMRLTPEQTSYGIQLAVVLNRLGRDTDAAQVYERVLARDPGLAAVRSNLAKTYSNLAVAKIGANDWEGALAEIDRALAHAPGLAAAEANRKAAMWNWAISVQETDPARALSLFQSYIQLDPTAAQAHASIGAIYMKNQDYARAAAAFRAALAVDSSPAAARNLAAAHHRHGVQMHRAGRLDDAVIQLQLAVDATPNNLDLYRSLGVAHRAAGRHAEAIAAFQAARTRDPQLEWAGEEIQKVATAAGNEALGRRDYAAALAHFESIPHDMRDPQLHGMVGFLYLETGDLAKSVDNLGLALMGNPADPTSRQNLDFCLKEIKKLRREDDSPVWGLVLQRLEAFRLVSVIARKGRKADVARFEELLRAAADDEDTIVAIRAAAIAVVEAIQPNLPEAADRIAAAARAPDPGTAAKPDAQRRSAR
jgi:tetratricopeptide (TPR) repeat protein